MRHTLLACLLSLYPALAAAQCNPTLPGTCATNDPVLFGLQQQQQQQMLKMQEINNQNLKLQQIERENTQRYQTPTPPAIHYGSGGPAASSSIIVDDPYRSRVRAKAKRQHAATRGSKQRRRH